MTAKKWLAAFGITAALIATLLALFNVLTDPFGVFGDPLLHWYSYNETNNPRAAKISYLEQHHDEYDSYILGCSSTSSFSKQALDRYYDASFYNMIMYGADMQDVEQTCAYLLKNYTVKNIVLNVYIDNGITYGYESNPLTDSQSNRVDGTSPLAFYPRFLFANPSYGTAKLRDRKTDGWLQQAYDVFDEPSGAYDKTRRDAEAIGNSADYLAAYPVFADYPQASLSLPQTENCMASVQRIRAMCEQAGVTITVVTAPVYGDYLAHFPREAVEKFYRALADVTDFWDFSYSSVSLEPRYFYDATHFRNCVGDMAFARIFSDSSVYVPSDFGRLVTKQNAAEAFSDAYWNAQAVPDDVLTADVPILMYHHITDEMHNTMTITPAFFEEQIAALNSAGYTAVSLDQLEDFVLRGTALPEKPIAITFDDGYESNYEYAYPILQKYGMCGTIFAIGSMVGKTTYKDTDYPIIPHFSAEQATEMTAAGVINVQSHTYDMHQAADYEPGTARTTIMPFPDEPDADYVAALQQDQQQMRTLLEPATGRIVDALAYPLGEYTELTQAVLVQAGIRVTVTTIPGENTLVKGLPQSLLSLKRYAVNDDVPVSEVLQDVLPARGA